MRSVIFFRVSLLSIAWTLTHHTVTKAAPHPATSSSFVVGADSGRYFSENGFKVSIGKSKWSKIPPPKSFENIEVVFRGPAPNSGNPAPSLTVRRDDLGESMDLEKYIQRWRNDYPRFGFDVLNSQKVKVGQNIAFLLDLAHPETGNQLRQVVFVKNKKAAIFTCRDKRETFKKTLPECNEIVRTFKWTL